MMPKFDALIHAPNRLQICAFLNAVSETEFRILREELGVSDSVLSKHLKLLEKEQYVSFRKGSVDGRKRMWVRLTLTGQKAFSGHVKELHSLASIS